MEKETIRAYVIGLICGFIIGFVWFGLPSISAVAEWPMDKAGTCALPQYNKTGIDCEIFWCNIIRGGVYNLSLEVCEFRINESIIINSTIYVNVTQNQTNLTSINWTEIEGKYYNKTQIDSFFNDSTNSIVENYMTKDDFNLKSFVSPEPTSNGIDNSTLLFIVVIIVVVIAFVIFQNRKNASTLPTDRGEAHVEFRKLQSQKTTKELGTEKKLEETSAEIQKISSKLQEMEKEKIERDKKDEQERLEKDRRWEKNNKQANDRNFASRVKKAIDVPSEEMGGNEEEGGEN